MKKKSDFDLSLHFRPLAPWPQSLPAVAVGPYLLAGFDRSDDHPTYYHEILDLESNTQVFLELYPQLSLPEIARLLRTSAFSQILSQEILLRGYHLSPSQDLLDVCKMITNTSLEFQNWLSAKKVGYHELLPMLPLDYSQREFVALTVLNSQDSKTEGVQRIEWTSDLLLMGQHFDNLKDLTLFELKTKRFPNTTSRDQKLAQAHLSWSKTIRSQFSRRGDKGGFDIHFFAGTPVELTKTAQNLLKVAEEWNSDLNKNS